MGYIEDRIEEMKRKARADMLARERAGRGGIGSQTTTGSTAPSPAIREELSQRNDQTAAAMLPAVRPKPSYFTPVTRTLDSLHTDIPDKEGLRPVADTAKKVAKMYSQITGGRVLLPDVHLALVMSGMPMNQIEALLRSEPERVAQIVAGDDDMGLDDTQEDVARKRREAGQPDFGIDDTPEDVARKRAAAASGDKRVREDGSVGAPIISDAVKQFANKFIPKGDPNAETRMNAANDLYNLIANRHIDMPKTMKAVEPEAKPILDRISALFSEKGLSVGLPIWQKIIVPAAGSFGIGYPELPDNAGMSSAKGDPLHAEIPIGGNFLLVDGEDDVTANVTVVTVGGYGDTGGAWGEIGKGVPYDLGIAWGGTPFIPEYPDTGWLESSGPSSPAGMARYSSMGGSGEETNTHIIPGNAGVLEKLQRIKPGDKVVINGKLVDISLQGPKTPIEGGYTRVLETELKTSKIFGDFDCEIIYVTDIQMPEGWEARSPTPINVREGTNWNPGKAVAPARGVAPTHIAPVASPQKQAADILGKTKTAGIEPTAKGVEPTPEYKQDTPFPGTEQPKNQPETVAQPPITWSGTPPTQEESGVAPQNPTQDLAKRWVAEHPTEPLPDWVITQMDMDSPIYPSYIAEAMAETTPESQGISQGTVEGGDVAGWGGDTVPAGIASIVPTAEGQNLVAAIGESAAAGQAEIDENTKIVNANIAYLEDQKVKALSGDYATDETTIPTIDAALAGEKDKLTQIGEAGKKIAIDIADWQNNPVGRYKREMDSQIKETYLAGEAMNLVFGEGGYGKRMVTEEEAAERESHGERVTRFNEPFKYADAADLSLENAGTYIGYADDYGDDEDIEYRRRNYDRWQRKGAQMLPDSTNITHVGVESLKDTYDVNDPNSKSERVMALQRRLDSFVGLDGQKKFPVAITGRLDDPYTEMAVNQLAYERAVIYTVLPTTDPVIKERAKKFIDEYNGGYAAKVIALDPDISSIEVSNDPDLIENAPNLTPEQREQYASVRKQWATKLQSLTTKDVLGGKSFFESWDVTDEYRFDTLPEASAVKNSDFMYLEGEDGSTAADEMLFQRALQLRNPNVPESEFAVWWLNNVGEDSMPKEYKDLYNKGRMDEMLQSTGALISQLGESASLVKGDIVELAGGVPGVTPAVRESFYAAQSIQETIASFKPFENGSTLGEVTGEIGEVAYDTTIGEAGRAVKGIGEGLNWAINNLIEIPALAIWLSGVAATEYLNDKISDVAHDPFNGYTYSDQNLGSMRDFAVMWKNSYEEAYRINNDTSGENPTSFMPYMMDYYGYPTEKEPILPFLADLVFETKGLKLIGAPAKIAKVDWGVPAATKLGMKLPHVDPLVTRVVNIGKVADDAGVLARKVDDIYDVMPGLRRLEYAPLAEELRYVDVDDVDAAKTLIADYARSNPAAGDVVSLFEDSLTGTVINQTKMRMEDSRVGGKIAPVIRGLMRPVTTTNGDEVHHIRDPFDTITQNAQAAYYTRTEIARWNGRLHELLGTSGTPQAATEQVLNEMLEDIYLRAGTKHFSHLNPLAAAKKVKDDIATYTGKQLDIRQLPSKVDDGISYPTSMVGGKKSSELAGAVAGGKEAELDTSRQLMASLADDAIPVGVVDDTVDNIDDLERLSRDAIDELEIMSERAAQDGMAHVELQRALGVMEDIQGSKEILKERATKAEGKLDGALTKSEDLAGRGKKKVEGGLLDEFMGKSGVNAGRGDKYAGAGQMERGASQFPKADRVEATGKELLARGQKQLDEGTKQYEAYRLGGSVGKDDGLAKIWQGYKNIDNGEKALVNSGKWRMRGSRNLVVGRKRIASGEQRISNGWVRASGGSKKVAAGDALAVKSEGVAFRGKYDFDRAMEPIDDAWAEYRASFADSYSRIVVPKTAEEANAFTTRVSKLGEQLGDYVNRARVAGLNPADDPEFLRAAATYQAMVTSARTSEWWLKGYDLDFLHSNFVSNAAKVKNAAAKEKQWALTQRQLAVQQHSPFFSFQMPTYSHHPIRPAIAYLKHGPNGTFMRMLNNNTVDGAMRAWRSAVLFGLGTQVRIMSDEGGRLLDQGIGIDALMGLGKYKIAKDLPYWVKGMGGYRSDFEKYTPKMFDEMGGTTGKPYTKNALNWLFTNLSGKSNETGGLLEKWMAAERKGEDGAEVLRKFAISNNMKTSFSSGLPQEITKQQRGAYVRLQEMTNRVGVGANVKWAKEADNFFRNDLGLGKGDDIDGIMDRFIAAGKKGKSGNLSELEFTMLTDGGTKLPRIIAPSQFTAENPNKARQWINTAEQGVSKLFTPLEIMNGQVKAGFFRQGYVQKYEAILKANGGSLPRELDKQLAHEAATRAGTRFMEENVYSGFKTAFEYQYRNVMPFGSAYRDFLTYWGKAFATKPSHFAYASYLNLKLEDNVDSEFPMGRALAQKIGFDIADSSVWSFKPSSMTFLTGGSGGFVPAVGPAVTLPLAYARDGLEKMGFDTDWIGEIPVLSFSDPGMAMFSKINKLVYGLSGQKFVQDAASKVGIEYDEGFNLSRPFGPKKESVDSKINDATRMEYYRWVRDNKRQPNSKEMAELEQRGRDSVETDFMVEFLGQYMSPAGFQQTNEAENIARALTLYRNAKPSEREQVRLFLTGESDAPPESIIEYNAKPLDAEGLEIFKAFIEISKLPDKRSPNMQTTKESMEDMLADHPEMIPFFTGKTERLSDGREPVTTAEKQNAYTQSVVEVSQLDPSTFSSKIGEKIGEYIGKGDKSVLGQRIANQTEKSFNDEITAYAKSIGIDNPSTEIAKDTLDQIPYPGTNESWEARRKRLESDNEYGNLTAKDKSTAAQAMAHGGVGQLPDKDIRLISESATFVGEKINAATKKRLEYDMTGWGMADFAAAGQEVSETTMRPWSQANLAEITITARMKAEQGETITFSSKAGKAYAAELDTFIDGLAAENPGWAEQYAMAKGPRWAQMQKLGYGTDDPATKGQWDAAYTILGDMTTKMTDAKSAAEKSEIYKAAMAEIDKLKAENDAFAKQFAVLKQSTTNPSTAQLRAWGGDYAKNGSKAAKGYSKKAKGIRRGVRGKKSKKGGGIKAVKRTTGKKKLRVRRP